MRSVIVLVIAGSMSLVAQQRPVPGPVDAYACEAMPDGRGSWQSRFPSDNADATESLGRYSGTFRGDQNWKIHFDVRIDPTFAPNQKVILRAAMDVLAQELFAGRVWNCAEREGLTLPRPTVGDFQDRLYQMLRVENAPVRTLYVTRFWYDATGIAGLARLNYVDQAGNFWITLNSQKIGDGVIGAFNSSRAWAGIVAHEMLHNLGLVHPIYDRQGTRNEFIYAFGDCM